MRAAVERTSHFNVFLTMAVGITALSFPMMAYAAPGDLNSINSGQNVAGGTYFNTAGSRTTFINPNGGLWLQSGTLVRGLESNANRTPNGNGGTLYFRAPGNVVRLDGNIDVSAVRNGALYTGNGGKVFVDSGYLFQSGNVFANGSNGGLVQFNVGGMTLGPNAQITAQGFGGNGGSVNITAPGTVDLQTGSIVDTSGRVAGTIDTNVINIEGSVVNNQGIIRANGAFGQDLKPNNGDSTVMANNPQLANNPAPPPISAGNGTNDTATMQNVLFQVPANADFRGGVIRLVAAGQNNSTTEVINAAASPLSSGEKSALNNRNSALVQSNNGDVFNRGALVADGTLGKNGGTIIVAAARNVINSSTIRALGGSGIDGVFSPNGSGSSGGNGGTIVITAMNAISNNANIQANGGQGARANNASATTGTGANATATAGGTAGSGGQGGVLAFSYGAGMNNTGALQANGGLGGNGGHSNSFDTEGATAENPNPVARATSNAGTGGAGGIGGLIVFSGSGNPTGGGSTTANGGQGGRGGNAWADAHASSNIGVPTAQAIANKGAGGTGGVGGSVVTQNPGGFTGQVLSTRSGGVGNSGTGTSRQIVITNGNAVTTTGSSPVTTGSVTTGNNRALLTTRRNDYIRHEDTAILLSQNSGVGSNNTTLTGRLSDSLVRTVNTPGGAAVDVLANAESSANFIVASTTPQAFDTNLDNANVNPMFFNLNTLTILNNGNYTNNMLWTPGVHLVGAGFHDMTMSVGGGHISWLANGTITNNDIVITRGLWSGGTINVAATQDVVNNNDFINIAPFKELLSGFNTTGPKYDSSHAGNILLKGGRDVTNSNIGKLASNLIFFDIHPPLAQNPPIDWPRFLNGAQIGATVNLLAGRNLVNNGLVRADALTYRNGALGEQNPALAMGGIIVGRSNTGTTTNNGAITALGNSFFSPNEADGARFNTNTFPAATSFNGNIDFR